MAFFSISEFTADGVSDIVPVPFPYLLQEHVHVLLDGVPVDDALLVFTTPSTIQLPEVPTAGTLVRVFRSTPLDVASVVFQAGPFSHKDLNTQVDHLLFAAQEVADIAAQTISLNVDGEWEGQGAPLINVADPVVPEDPQDVPTVAYGDANWGGAAAEAAQTSADAAAASASAAALSEANADASELAADQSEANAAQSAADAAASAAAVELPDPAVANTMLKRNAANTTYVAQTAADIRAFLSLVVGVDVQAFDADIPTVAATQGEMEAGTETARRSMSPLGVAQAIAALETFVVAAVKAQQEAATDLTVFVSPGVQQFHPSAAKARASFDGDSAPAVLQSSYNVTSLTDNDVGDYTITWETDFSTATYSVFVTAEGTSGGTVAFFGMIKSGSQTAGSVGIQTAATTTAAKTDVPHVHVVAFGDQ